MEKYTDYIVLDVHSNCRSEACSKLSLEVRKHLVKGWIPQGGVSISVCKHGYDEFYTLTQAMVKIEKIL